jgi:hypothetical protein
MSGCLRWASPQGGHVRSGASEYLAIAVETWLLSGAVSASLESDANALRRVMPALTKAGGYLQCWPAEKGEVRDLQEGTDSAPSQPGCGPELIAPSSVWLIGTPYIIGYR